MSVLLGLQIGAWPSREMAANGIMFVDPPERFWVAAVVPFFPDKQLLSHEAAIQHLSNRYCGKRAHKQVWFDLQMASPVHPLQCLPCSSWLMHSSNTHHRLYAGHIASCPLWDASPCSCVPSLGKVVASFSSGNCRLRPEPPTSTSCKVVYYCPANTWSRCTAF